MAVGLTAMAPAQTVNSLRLPAVAGLFYPDDPYELRAVVQRFLDDAPAGTGRPKAIIVPHAGYVYSGAIAAAAFRSLVGVTPRYERVVLAGPSHRVAVPGIALPDVAAFETPLGEIPLDRAMLQRLAQLPEVLFSNAPHRLEHSLEVQLPFLQMTLGEFTLVPLAVGDASREAVRRVLNECWGGDETLIVASTDLSHYRDYLGAREVDEATVAAILERRDDLNDEQACGCRVLNGLMQVATQRGLGVQALEIGNSGDTSGDLTRVVGYGSFALYGDAA